MAPKRIEEAQGDDEGFEAVAQDCGREAWAVPVWLERRSEGDAEGLPRGGPDHWESADIDHGEVLFRMAGSQARPKAAPISGTLIAGQAGVQGVAGPARHVVLECRFGRSCGGTPRGGEGRDALEETGSFEDDGGGRRRRQPSSVDPRR